MSTLPSVTVSGEFIKLARALLAAQAEARHSQRWQRRADSLKQTFDAKLSEIEKQIANIEKARAEQGSESFPFGKLI